MEIEPEGIHLCLQLLDVTILASPTLVWGAFSIVILLLICSALVSGSEVAYYSLDHNDISELRDRELVQASARRVLLLLEHPKMLLATILIANNIINILIILLSSMVLENWFSEGSFLGLSKGILKLFPTLENHTSATGLNDFFDFFIKIVVVTFLLVLFGEVSPKVYAKLHNLTLAQFMSKTLVLLSKIFSPLSKLLVRGSTFIEKRLQKRFANTQKEASEDIHEAIELTVSNNPHSPEEVDILKGIVKFNNITVKQIMTSRVDVQALDFDIDFFEVLEIVKNTGYSRLPVIEEDFDNVIGILNAKDLLVNMEEAQDFEWQELIRSSVLYAPESRKINEVLKDFQLRKQHMAIVVDEYGGSSGIVTLDDILEEVIGDIHDEFDVDEDIDYLKIDEKNYEFEGKTLINDFCRIISLEPAYFDEIRGNADSLAGLILEKHKAIPRKKAKIKVDNFEFEILAASKRRIERIKVKLPKD